MRWPDSFAALGRFLCDWKGETLQLLDLQSRLTRPHGPLPRDLLPRDLLQDRNCRRTGAGFKNRDRAGCWPYR